MTRFEIIAQLQAASPRASLAECAMYAEAFEIYREASVNVRQNGSVVAHPRTGSPIENPCLKVQAAQIKTMLQFQRINADSLWHGDCNV